MTARLHSREMEPAPPCRTHARYIPLGSSLPEARIRVSARIRPELSWVTASRSSCGSHDDWFPSVQRSWPSDPRPVPTRISASPPSKTSDRASGRLPALRQPCWGPLTRTGSSSSRATALALTPRGSIPGSRPSVPEITRSRSDAMTSGSHCLRCTTDHASTWCNRISICVNAACGVFSTRGTHARSTCPRIGPRSSPSTHQMNSVVGDAVNDRRAVSIEPAGHRLQTR